MNTLSISFEIQREKKHCLPSKKCVSEEYHVENFLTMSIIKNTLKYDTFCQKNKNTIIINITMTQRKQVKIEGLIKNFPELFQKLQGSEKCVFFKQLEPALNVIIQEHTDTKKLLHVLGKEHEDRVAEAVLKYDFRNIYEIKGEYTPVLKAAAKKNKLKHEIIRWRLQQPDQLGLTANEVTLIRESLAWCEAIDEVFIPWRRFMKESPIGQMLANLEEEPGAGAEWLKKHSLDNAYSIVRKNRDVDRLVSMKEAFPTPYKKIHNALDSLLQKLQLQKKEEAIPAFLHYFEKLQMAHNNTHLEKMEKIWREVDIAWLETEGRIQFIHGMEKNYIDPTGIRVAPSLRITIEDAQRNAVNTAARKTQQMLEKHFAQHYSHKKTWKASVEAMKKIQLQVCIPITFAGSDIEFLGVGKIVPERSDVRRKYGTKIFLDYNGMETRRNESRTLFQKVFGSEGTVQYFRLSTADIITHLIAGHEIGHGAFVDDITTDALTPSLLADIEEAKSTWCGMMCAHFRYKAGEISKEIWLQLPIMLLAGNLRYLRLREESTLRPYYNATLLELHMMIKSGLIQKNSAWWSIHEKNTTAFYALLAQYHERMIDIYDQGNKKKAQKLLSEMKTNPDIEDLHKRVIE